MVILELREKVLLNRETEIGMENSNKFLPFVQIKLGLRRICRVMIAVQSINRSYHFHVCLLQLLQPDQNDRDTLFLFVGTGRPDQPVGKAALLSVGAHWRTALFTYPQQHEIVKQQKMIETDTKKRRVKKHLNLRPFMFHQPLSLSLISNQKNNGSLIFLNLIFCTSTSTCTRGAWTTNWVIRTPKSILVCFLFVCRLGLETVLSVQSSLFQATVLYEADGMLLLYSHSLPRTVICCSSGAEDSGTLFTGGKYIQPQPNNGLRGTPQILTQTGNIFLSI